MIMETIGDRIQYLANQKFGSQVGMAKKLEINPQNLSRTIKKSTFNQTTINKIIEIVPGLNIHWLFTGEGEIYIKNQENHVSEPIPAYSKKPELPEKIAEAHKLLMEAHEQFLDVVISELKPPKSKPGRPLKNSESESKK
jgi:hypothetical protein